MSLILDALNRSRQDSEKVPGLSAMHPVEQEVTDLSWLPWLLLSALALAVLAIGWLLLDRQSQPAPVPPVAAVASVPAPAQAPAQPAPPAAPAGADARPATVAAPSPRPAAPVAPVAERSRQPAPGPAAAKPAPAPVDASVAALYQQEQAPARAPVGRQQPAATARQVQTEESGGARPREEPVDIERLVAKARDELADARLSDSDVPFLSTLSQQSKDAVPTLMYLRHDYSGNPAASTVVINGKTLHAGGSVGGVKVEEILPDSVVLEYQGSRFRLRALNSWVNL
ncbi:MAG: general secretion pathway protein GspB [Gammaproteobacteria bacterium]|nr:general secretion pathway protein GspB [Gammaproteobacteria bacterium]